MRSSNISLCLLLIGTLLFSACAKKPVADPQASPAAPEVVAPAASEPLATAEVIEAPQTASLNLMDGSHLETIFFDFDSHLLSTAARKALTANAAWLQANPQAKITVEGHCDERGADEYNLALGERRAVAVKDYLVTLGVNGERIATISYGEDFPAVPGHDETAWAKNRRAAFK